MLISWRDSGVGSGLKLGSIHCFIVQRQNGQRDWFWLFKILFLMRLSSIDNIGRKSNVTSSLCGYSVNVPISPLIRLISNVVVSLVSRINQNLKSWKMIHTSCNHILSLDSRNIKMTKMVKSLGIYFEDPARSCQHLFIWSNFIGMTLVLNLTMELIWRWHMWLIK